MKLFNAIGFMRIRNQRYPINDAVVVMRKRDYNDRAATTICKNIVC